MASEMVEQVLKAEELAKQAEKKAIEQAANIALQAEKKAEEIINIEVTAAKAKASSILLEADKHVKVFQSHAEQKSQKEMQKLREEAQVRWAQAVKNTVVAVISK